MQQFIDYVRGLGAIGYIVYTLGYAIIGLFVPASVLTIGAGALSTASPSTSGSGRSSIIGVG